MTEFAPKVRCATVLVCLRLAFALSLARMSPAAIATEVEVDGEFTSGIEVLEFKNGRAKTEAELKLETERSEGIKGVIELEMDNLDRKVELEEVFIDGKFESDNKLVFGLTKKILGLEYERKNKERLPVSRTLIYRKLETFAYVGKETTLRFVSSDKDDDGVSYKVGAGYSESLDYNLTGLVKIPVAEDLDFYWSGLLQSDKISQGRQMVWASVLSALYENDSKIIEAELFSGVDPFESEFEKNFGESRKVIFAGGKLLLGIRLGEERRFRPFLVYSNVRHDMEFIRYYSTQYLTGLDYYVTKKLTLAVNLDLVSTNNRVDYKKRNWNDSSIVFEASLKF